MIVCPGKGVNHFTIIANGHGKAGPAKTGHFHTLIKVPETSADSFDIDAENS
jgi:hypothetical protein